jgi:hypothetical protein
MTRLCALVAMVVLAVGCGDATPAKPADMSMPVMNGADIAVYSLCGHPGDNGNSKSVGKYCMEQSMCPTGTICSTIQSIPQGPTYFCTIPCDINAANPNAPCGEKATCTCLNPGMCGCVPDDCRIGLFG